MLDAIIVSDSGTSSYSGTNPLKLTIDDRTADIQVVLNAMEHGGEIVPPVENDNLMSWSSAPKLNGIYLFNYLSKHHFNVELVNSFYAEEDKFRRLLKQSPKAVIISTTFISEKEPLFKLTTDIRHLAPDVFIITGGSFIYGSFTILQRSRGEDYIDDTYREQALFLDINDEPDVDLYIVSLSGEKILGEALTCLKENRSTNGLPNSARLVDNTYHFSERVDDFTDYEYFPIDWASLPDYIFASGVVPLQASTGCPYNCAFCNFIADHRLNRVKPLDQLVSEMKAVSGRGARYVWFVDDNFRLSQNDLDEVSQRFIDEGLDLNWMTFIRASTLNTVDIGLLQQAGCIEVQLGLESADPQILKNMNKKATPELYDSVLEKLLSAGMNCSCYFIFGFPGETPDSAHRTREFIKRKNLTIIQAACRVHFFRLFLPHSALFMKPGLVKNTD